VSSIELPFGEAAEGRGAALSRRDLLAATAGVDLAGSLAGNAATALAAGTGAKPERRGKEGLREVLDFLVTEEQLGVASSRAGLTSALGVRLVCHAAHPALPSPFRHRGRCGSVARSLPAS
jgi:hypothetical protein